MAHLAQVCVCLGDTHRAATLYGLLRPYARLNATIGSVACFGSVSHYLGLLATLRRRWKQAVSHFEAALAMHQRMQARPLLVYTQQAYASMLLARGRPGDRDQARKLSASPEGGAIRS